MNATRLLRSSLAHACFDEKKAKFIEAKRLQELNYHALFVMRDAVKALTDKYGEPWWYFPGADVHVELKRTALAPDGLSRPAHLEIGAQVVHVDADAGVVTVKDGRPFTGDVVIGADGIRSPSGKDVFPDQLITTDSNFSAYRCMIDSAEMRRDRDTAIMVDCAKVLMLIAKDRRIVAYPCSSWEWMNFVCIFPDGRPRDQQ